METVVVLLIGAALVLAILGGSLLVARRNKRRIPLEPPPGAPGIPEEVKEDVARRNRIVERGRLSQDQLRLTRWLARRRGPFRRPLVRRHRGVAG